MKRIHSERTAPVFRAALIPFAAALLAFMPVKEAAADNGQQLYMLHCSGCHGINGISVVPDAKNFSRIDLMAQPDQNLVSLIRSGRNLMPPYLGILSDQEMVSIINYIRTLN